MRNFTGSVPNLVLARRVVEKMLAGARQFIADETGEAMVGIVDPGSNTGGVPTIYVLDTIAPDETNVVREYYMFQQGDERQYEIFTWLNANWKTFRQKLNGPLEKKWDVALAHVGDWHKQPGFMTAPSRGDLMSALDQLEDSDDADFLLVPIVTLGHPTCYVPTGANYLYEPNTDGTYIRIDFWYIHRGMREFMPIVPAVYPDEQVPPTFPLPWHLEHHERATNEISALEREGYLVSPVIVWDTDEKAPLEVCMIMARGGDEHMLLIVTQHDYPNHPPRIYRAPVVSMGEDDDWYDVFETVWKTAELIDAPHLWSHETHLVDRIASLQAKGKE